VNLEKGRATYVLFLGDTTLGAERDLVAREVPLRPAISQPPISETGDAAMPPLILDGRHPQSREPEPERHLAAGLLARHLRPPGTTEPVSANLLLPDRGDCRARAKVCQAKPS
jgi:hypothetical protein